jgi:hypothetical protein
MHAAQPVHFPVFIMFSSSDFWKLGFCGFMAGLLWCVGKPLSLLRERLGWFVRAEEGSLWARFRLWVLRVCRSFGRVTTWRR